MPGESFDHHAIIHVDSHAGDSLSRRDFAENYDIEPRCLLSLSISHDRLLSVTKEFTGHKKGSPQLTMLENDRVAAKSSVFGPVDLKADQMQLIR